MEVRATGKRMRVPPRKARLVASELKGKHALMALAQLRYHPSNGAQLLRKVLSSAVANAVENEGREPESLIISRINVDEGMRMKRMRARAQGRGNRILKRTSHITVVLEDGDPLRPRKSNAKPKPRPKFGEGGKKKSKAAAKPDVVEEPTAEQAAEIGEPEEVKEERTEEAVADAPDAEVSADEGAPEQENAGEKEQE